jgi:repressor LexA
MATNEQGEAVRVAMVGAIKRYIQRHGYPPTVREIGAMVGLKSSASVQRHIEKLFKEGKLETDAEPGTPRAIRIPGHKLVEEENI